jgi:hypothetical protein
MGAQLSAKAMQADSLGVQAKVKFALLTGLTVEKAKNVADTPEMLAKVDDALKQVKALFG